MELSAGNLVLKTIETLIQFQDLRQVQAKADLETYMNDTYKLITDLGLKKGSINRNFMQSVNCLICKTKYCTFILDCNHQFCSKCLEDKTGLHPNTIKYIYRSPNSPKCPKCLEPITKPESKRFIAKFLGDSAPPTIDKNLHNCRICKFPRSASKFPFICLHICLYCHIQNHRRNSCCMYCYTMEERFDINEFKGIIRCDGCGEDKKIDRDKVTEICDDHVQCYECLKVSWKNMHCAVCRVPLNYEKQLLLKGILFKKCFSCHNELEIKDFVTKKCCNYGVCWYCQYNSMTDSCQACHTRLPENLIKALKSMAVIADSAPRHILFA